MKTGAKFDWSWLAALLPALMGVLLVVVLVEFGLIEFHFTIHDVDTLIILGGLLLTIVLSSVLISREGVRRMQQFSLKQARADAAAEHARFLRRLDHELKNPLMGIRAATVNMADTDDANARQRIRISIDSQVERLTRLVIDLRKVAELETHPLERMPLQIGSILQETFSLALEEIDPASRQVSLHLPEHMPTLYGDPDLLLAAFYNLLSNALKYTQHGDSIMMRASVTADEIMIEVEDTGIGIDPADLPYVWDELFRSEYTKGIAGSGIGLALVKRIIERHGGMVDLRSEFGRGTTVLICLPYPGQPAATKRVSSAE